MWNRSEPTREDAERLLRRAREAGMSEVDAVWRLLLQANLGRWFQQRLASAGSGRIMDITLTRDSYVFTTCDHDRFEFVSRNNGRRWRHRGDLVSRNDVERELGVWPGYIDAVEDLCGQILEMIEEVEREKNTYAARLEIEAAEKRKRELAWLAGYSERIERHAALERHSELKRWRLRNPTSADGCPQTLRHIRHIKRLDVSEPCYVYFLLRKGQVVYVGQTSAPWPARILSHLKDGTKEFDDVWYLEVDAQSIIQVEARFIREFDPPYNRTHTTHATKSS